jgi:hypothetical protein
LYLIIYVKTVSHHFWDAHWPEMLYMFTHMNVQHILRMGCTELHQYKLTYDKFRLLIIMNYDNLMCLSLYRRSMVSWSQSAGSRSGSSPKTSVPVASAKSGRDAAAWEHRVLTPPPLGAATAGGNNLNKRYSQTILAAPFGRCELSQKAKCSTNPLGPLYQSFL